MTNPTGDPTHHTSGFILTCVALIFIIVNHIMVLACTTPVATHHSICRLCLDMYLPYSTPLSNAFWGHLAPLANLAACIPRWRGLSRRPLRLTRASRGGSAYDVIEQVPLLIWRITNV